MEIGEFFMTGMPELSLASGPVLVSGGGRFNCRQPGLGHEVDEVG